MTEPSRSDLERQVAELTSELATRMAELETMHLEKQQLIADLEVKHRFVSELRIGTSEFQDELEALRCDQAKLNRIRNVVRRIPGARLLTGRVARHVIP